MNALQPIYTEQAECQDCYKCVRSCPVKAINVTSGRARVDGEACLFCARCLRVCPVGAKRVRNDTARARQLVARDAPVYLSLAPAFAAEFTDISRPELVSALLGLGFAGVSETALGADIVSQHVRRELEHRRLVISTACPVVVELVDKYYPHLQFALSAHASPMVEHAQLLKQLYGPEAQVVFAGPCVAKKRESDLSGRGPAVALTFADLRAWMSETPPSGVPRQPNAQFVPYESVAGARYPIDGGMSATLGLAAEDVEARCVSVSGIEAIERALYGLDERYDGPPLFLELLACEGGCVNGPGMSREAGTALKRSAVLREVTRRAHSVATTPAGETMLAGVGKPAGATTLAGVGEPAGATTPAGAKETAGAPTPAAANAPPPPRFQVSAPTHRPVSEAEIAGALELVGKRTVDDELNCGGCGYDTCRAFGAAMVRGRAEAAMCVTYMRRLAQKTNTKLLATMPSAVVTVDAQLRIVEANANFARLCGAESELAFEALPGLEGALVDRFVPCSDLFRAVLSSGSDLLDRTMKLNGRIVKASFFSIESGRLAGALLRDITEPSVQREHIVGRAREVIERNLKTVQEIAYLLGENAGETELLLTSIVDSFGGGQ